MKFNIKHLSAIGLLSFLAIGAGTSCTDKVAFGDAFLEKAPGGTVTADTVFNNAEYTRDFLARIYSRQYYNLPTNSSNSLPQWMNYWHGAPDMLGDTYNYMSTTAGMATGYYNQMLSSSFVVNQHVYPYHNMQIWENVRACYVLMEHIEGVPGMDESEKARITDEAKCLLVYTYFGAFRHFGALPIIKATFNGDETEFTGRSSVADNIDFMVGLLDEVINAGNLPWAYTESNNAASETGHWTLAGAMALKCQVLQWAASPLFNAAQPYYEGKYSMEHPEYVWLGGYDASRWTQFRDACKAFFDRLASGGHYHLNEAEEKTAAGYAYAFRSSYMLQDSPEVLHSVRNAYSAHGNDYNWFNLSIGFNSRMSYCPTQEYVEMFPWADGTPFDWDKTAAENRLDEMFVKGERVQGQQMLQNLQYTRDPRLYETVMCNNVPQTIEWNNGNRSGAPYELYIGGTTAANGPAQQDAYFGTGYGNLKYIAGEAFRRQKAQWCPLLLSDMYLMYAEALCQTDQLSEALRYVDAVRARVGLKGLAECNPGKNLTGDKSALLEEILRERACEFGMQGFRYYDMIRYKRADLFEKTLHGIHIYRMLDGQRNEQQWYNGDRTSAKEGTEAWYQPNHFEYEVVPLQNHSRKWWTDGFDPKWYLNPFPITEVNKNYGLDQNPGW